MGDANPSWNSPGRNLTGGDSRWNGTRPRGNWSHYDDDGDGVYDRSKPGWWNADRDGNSVYADSMVTYVIATCYLSFLCFVAVIMCFKNMTRLRVIAAIVTFAGLSIAVVGYLRANNTVLPNIYWAWNFLAESLAVIALAIAIVSVGSGFYPMTGGRSIYARMSFVVIFLYAFVSLGTVIVYVQQRVVKHFIPPEQVKQLRIDIVRTEVLSLARLNKVIRNDIMSGAIPNNTDIYGAASYDQLSMPEQTYYMRPSLGFYLGHQVFMLVTCVWVCMYLFIPLVKNHRHGPAGRSVDSDMMAIGVWYLTCLMSLAAVSVSLFYRLMFFVFLTHPFNPSSYPVVFCPIDTQSPSIVFALFLYIVGIRYFEHCVCLRPRADLQAPDPSAGSLSADHHRAYLFPPCAQDANTLLPKPFQKVPGQQRQQD